MPDNAESGARAANREGFAARIPRDAIAGAGVLVFCVATYLVTLTFREAPAVIATDAPAGVTPSPAAAVTAEPVGTLAPPEAIAGPVGESADIKGIILFSRNGGDLWQASGRELRNLTSTKSSRADSSPAWSALAGSCRGHPSRFSPWSCRSGTARCRAHSTAPEYGYGMAFDSRSA